MVYDGYCCYFLSTCQVDCQRDLVVHFTMFMPHNTKKNPPKLDDVIIFATTYIVIGSITTIVVVDGAFTTTSIDPKEINIPICSIGASTNQGKAIIQVSDPKSGGFDIDLETFRMICLRRSYQSIMPNYMPCILVLCLRL